MFNTEKRVTLSDFAHHFDALARDAQFFSVGKIPSRVKARLVPIVSTQYLGELVWAPDEVVAVICTSEIQRFVPPRFGCAVAADPIRATVLIHDELGSRQGYYWQDFTSIIAASAKIHRSAHVAERNVFIGEGTIVGPHAAVMERSIVGSRCQIGAGTIIGTDAFELAKLDGNNRQQSQTGGVRVGDDVVFLSNCTVARSTYPTFTEIGNHCGFDNLVHIAHDCVMEANCIVTAGTILSGRVSIKSGSYFGPNSTISNGIRIGENAKVTIGSTVVTNVENGEKVTGNFAIEHSRFLVNMKETMKSRRQG
jgi:acyl-[acyl carrier protein]--UDP-N-acetylglucosamine O-acyltransferase